jgi:hypothetical protein
MLLVSVCICPRWLLTAVLMLSWLNWRPQYPAQMTQPCSCCSKAPASGCSRSHMQHSMSRNQSHMHQSRLGCCRNTPSSRSKSSNSMFTHPGAAAAALNLVNGRRRLVALPAPVSLPALAAVQAPLTSLRLKRPWQLVCDAAGWQGPWTISSGCRRGPGPWGQIQVPRNSHSLAAHTHSLSTSSRTKLAVHVLLVAGAKVHKHTLCVHAWICCNSW